MKRKDLRPYLNKEVGIWSSKSYNGLRHDLNESACYDAKSDSFQYHVDVELLENCEEYVHVMVSVWSEHSGLSSFVPLCSDFLVYRDRRVDK